jgi:hypothetical protein
VPQSTYVTIVVRTGARSARQVEDERLLERIRELHAANYFAYGSRRMWKRGGCRARTSTAAMWSG